MPTEPDIPWERDELILALDLYRNHTDGKPPAEKLTALSRELREHLAEREGAPLLAKIRSTTGVGDKVRAFHALRLKTPASRGDSPLVREVWAEFGGQNKKVWDEATRIRERRAPPSA